MIHHAIRQYHYHRWANNKVFERLKQLPGKVYTREIKSVFSTVSKVIRHIYRTDGMWLSVMSGDSFDKTMKVIKNLEGEVQDKSTEEMHSLYEQMAGQYTRFLDNVDDLDKVFSINHPKYGELETSVAELVKHVANHGTYHRGNITAMLRQQGHAGVPTDYIFFLYSQKD